MLVKLDTPKRLVDAVAIISELVSEVRLKFLEDGLSLVAVDPANVAMVIFKMPKEAFSQYEAEKDILGVNMEDFKRILKRASSSASITFETEDNQLKISVLDKSKRVFILSLIEIGSEDKTEPALEFSCNVEMSSAEFAQTIEDCFVVADSCAFVNGAGFFVIESHGSISSARTEFSSDAIAITGIGRAKYSLEYLMKFIKASKISDKVKVNFSDNYPLRLEFAGDSLGMAFILAPRVEND